MDGNHMMEIVGNLIEMILCNAKFDKPAVRDLLAELGWTDADLEYFNVAWMFDEEEEDNDYDPCYECRGLGDDYIINDDGELESWCDKCGVNPDRMTDEE